MGAGRRLVAQGLNLLYRRFSTGRASPSLERPAGYKPALQQIENLRYASRHALRVTRRFLAALALALAATGLSAPAPPAIPPAFGPYTNLTAKDFAGSQSFKSTDRIVGTYYFYWYDVDSKAHLVDHDGTDALTTHPPTLEDFSYKSARWHQTQLADMEAAGIDVVLPVFWGAPSEQAARAGLHWSYAGLPPLVEAREARLRAGKRPPRIGLFYDTSTLRHNAWGQHLDLTTDYGRQWFYATIRDFFSLIPPKHWAMMDDRPIVLLYSAAFARQHDQSVIDHARREFAREFAGRVPWMAREVSWSVKADSTVAWGGALGLKNPGVASLGPGYDHSAVPGRTPLIVDRRGGKFYEENWLKFLRRPSNFVMVETWNEFHEGTDVAESREYGRQYIELTRKCADLFKRGWVPPWPQGEFSGAKSVTITLGSRNDEAGLRQVENDDGVTTPRRAADRDGRALQAGGKSHYMYFVVDESFKWAATMEVTLTVDYFDASAGTLAVEFDGSDPDAAFSGAYTRSPETVRLEGAQRWKTAQFHLPRARLLNSQNRGADFRLVLEPAAAVIGRVTLKR
jgi:hypothetical protein